MRIVKLTFFRAVVMASLSMAGLGCGEETSNSTDPARSAGEKACVDLCLRETEAMCGGFPSLPWDTYVSCDIQCAGFDEVEAPECLDEKSALFTCWESSAHVCVSFEEQLCPSQADAYNACAAVYGCVGYDVQEGSDMQGNWTCDSEVTCRMKKYEMACTESGTMRTCDCLIEGVSVGTCSSDSTPCFVRLSCCEEMYFHTIND